MQDVENIKKYVDEWAYDMKLNGVKNDGVTNIEVINQSIEMILATPRGSRLFNLSFGSDFSLRIFDNATKPYLERVLKDTIKSIERWEDRITIIKSGVKLNMNKDANMLALTIPYIINDRKISGEFSKIIRK